jgi:hypothetical protein
MAALETVVGLRVATVRSTACVRVAWVFRVRRHLALRYLLAAADVAYTTYRLQGRHRGRFSRLSKDTGTVQYILELRVYVDNKSFAGLCPQ